MEQGLNNLSIDFNSHIDNIKFSIFHYLSSKIINSITNTILFISAKFIILLNNFL